MSEDNNMDDAIDSVMKSDRTLAEQVYVKDGYIYFMIMYEYHIPLTVLKKPEDILSWCAHLLDKTWMTKDALQRFIRIASSESGIKLDK